MATNIHKTVKQGPAKENKFNTILCKSVNQLSGQINHSLNLSRFYAVTHLPKYFYSMFLPLFPSAYGQGLGDKGDGATDDDDNYGDGATDDDVDEDGDSDGATDDNGDGDGGTDGDDDDDDNGNDSDSAAAADNDIDDDDDDNNVNDIDDHNLPPRVGKRMIVATRRSRKRRGRSQILWRYTQQSNRSWGGGVVDGDDDAYDDDDKGSSHDNNDDNGGHGGWDGHHRMRKGRRHDNETNTTMK